MIKNFSGMVGPTGSYCSCPTEMTWMLTGALYTLFIILALTIFIWMLLTMKRLSDEKEEEEEKEADEFYNGEET